MLISSFLPRFDESRPPWGTGGVQRPLLGAAITRTPFARKRYASSLGYRPFSDSTQSTLEFDLRMQEFIELARTGNRTAALVYLKKHLAPWQETQPHQLAQACTLLAYTPATACKAYKVRATINPNIIKQLIFFWCSACMTPLDGRICSMPSERPFSPFIHSPWPPRSTTLSTPVSRPSSYRPATQLIPFTQIVTRTAQSAMANCSVPSLKRSPGRTTPIAASSAGYQGRPWMRTTRQCVSQTPEMSILVRPCWKWPRSEAI